MLKENKVARRAARAAKIARLEFIAQVEESRVPVASLETIRMARMMDTQKRFNALETHAQVSR